jgi:hypothetical protein
MSKLKLIAGMLLCAATMRAGAQEPPWNANAIKLCDRACLVGIMDEQKQIVATFPLFVHDGTRRGAPADAPPGMLQNLVTMETFSVRGGQIHHVEAAPFVTIPYGHGNGWTAGAGR